MTKFIIIILAVFKLSKNCINNLPWSPIFPNTRPNITQNVIKPKTLMPPLDVPSVLHTVSVALYVASVSRNNYINRTY